MYVSLTGASISGGVAVGTGVWLFWVAAAIFLAGAWFAIDSQR